jgi:hypothetical protein
VTKAYTKAEEERAWQAYELIHNAGFPSYQEAVWEEADLVHWCHARW